MRIGVSIPGGIRPKYAPEVLPLNGAQIAANCILVNGHIRPFFNYAQSDSLVNTGTIRTIYLYQGAYWLEWEADVDIVPAPISGDTAGKLYYTGHGIPKKTNLTEATTGAGAMPINFYPMAVPTPHAALSASLGGGGTGDDRVVNYVWTIVTSWYEEGLPSPASDNITGKSGQTVNLSAMTLAWQAGEGYEEGDFVFGVGDEGGTYLYKCITAGTSGASEPTWNDTVDGDTTDNTVTWRCYKNNLLEKRIYRRATGDQFGQYEYLDAIAASATTYTDTTADDDLNADDTLPSEDWDPPLDTLQGLVYVGHGILAGFVGKDIYFSEPYRPWTFPIKYSLSVPDTIVGLAPVGGDSLAVLTANKPVIYTGVDPSAMTPTHFPESAPCVSKRGSAFYRGGVVYPSNDGLVACDGAQTGLLTRDSYDAKTWPDVHPETMHGYIHDGHYFGFYSSGGEEGAIIVNLITKEVTTLGMYTDAAFRDVSTDTLYFVKDVEGTKYAYEWEGDTTQPFPLALKWRSRTNLYPMRGAFQVARVVSELGDRAAYQALIDAYYEALSRNTARISAGRIGGAIGENILGTNIEVNGDNLEDVDAVPDYSGDFSLIFRLYVDGSKSTERSIYSPKPFRLDSEDRGRKFFFEIEGNLEIDDIAVASSTEGLMIRRRQSDQEG